MKKPVVVIGKFYLLFIVFDCNGIVFRLLLFVEHPVKTQHIGTDGIGVLHLHRVCNVIPEIEITACLFVFMVNADNKESAVEYVLVLLYTGFILICIVGIP